MNDDILWIGEYKGPHWHEITGSIERVYYCVKKRHNVITSYIPGQDIIANVTEYDEWGYLLVGVRSPAQNGA